VHRQPQLQRKLNNIAGLRGEFKCKEKSLCVVEKQVFVEFSGRVEVVLALGEKELCTFVASVSPFMQADRNLRTT
jgi:hypothetical protein